MTVSGPTVLLFEPESVRHLGPPVQTRAVWDLRVGPASPLELVQKWAASRGGRIQLWSRPELSDLYARPDASTWQAESVLLLAGHQILLAEDGGAALDALDQGEAMELQGELLAKRCTGAEARDFLAALDWDASSPPGTDIARSALGPCLRFWWELYELAPELLSARLASRIEATGAQRVRGEAGPGPEDCYLAPSARIAPGVVFDTGAGPIFCDEDVELGAGSFVQGPCYLGPGTRVKALSLLLHGCFTGPQCRLGGEIEETQFQGFGNKQHHGFLGHAAVGEWVNLGAGVTNSDLKNNYSSIRVTQAEGSLDTGRRFLGSCLGDHVKVAIQGRLNTGSVFEPFVNWFGAAFPPKYLPAFSWAGDGIDEIYSIDKALATAAVVMGRRDQELSPALAAIYERIYRARVARDGD